MFGSVPNLSPHYCGFQHSPSLFLFFPSFLSLQEADSVWWVAATQPKNAAFSCYQSKPWVILGVGGCSLCWFCFVSQATYSNNSSVLPKGWLFHACPVHVFSDNGLITLTFPFASCLIFTSLIFFVMDVCRVLFFVPFGTVMINQFYQNDSVGLVCFMNELNFEMSFYNLSLPRQSTEESTQCRMNWVEFLGQEDTASPLRLHISSRGGAILN